jgi:hypothetical protein
MSVGQFFTKGVYKISEPFRQYQSIGSAWESSLKRQLGWEHWGEMEANHQYLNFNWLRKSETPLDVCYNNLNYIRKST